MATWRDDVWNEITKRFKDGEDAEEVIRDVAERFQYDITRQWRDDMETKLQRHNKKLWAPPPGAINIAPDQLSFEFEGDEYRIPDVPVRIVVDGDERFIPARLSNYDQRLQSNKARLDHYISQQVRTEAEINRDGLQNAKMEQIGLDTSQPWERLEHELNGTRCFRCLGGWREGDPFELGHYDAPASKGGVEVRWEHRSCNRSAKANPVARPVEFDES
jgi:hypothetical protein